MQIGSLSGSLTNLVDGTSYLIAGNNVTITSQSNGSVVISSTGGGSSGDQFFLSTTPGSIYTSGSAAFVGSGDEWGSVDSPLDKGSDVFFYVSGSIGSKDTIVAGTSLFGGDVTISGSLFASGDIAEITGSLTVTDGISGSLTNLPDGTSYLIAGANIDITTQSNGSVMISYDGSAANEFFVSTVAGSIFTSGSTAFIGSGDEWGVVDSPIDKGTDVFFYVSGTAGSRNTSIPGVAAFGGDVVITGSLFIPGNYLEITGTMSVDGGISGSLTTLSDGTSYLIAGNNISITSQSNGSVLISNADATTNLVYQPGGTPGGNVYTTWSSLMSAFNATVGNVTITVDPTYGQPVVDSGVHDFESRANIFSDKYIMDFPANLSLPDGAVLKDVRLFDNMDLACSGTTTSNLAISDRRVTTFRFTYVSPASNVPASAPIYTIGSGDIVLIDMDQPTVIDNTLVPFADLGSGGDLTVFATRGTVIYNDNFVIGTLGSDFLMYYDSSFTTNLIPVPPTNPNFTGTPVYAALDNSKLVSYDDAFVVGTLGSSYVQGAIDTLKLRWASTTPNALYTTSSVAVIGNEAIDAAADKGTDVFFYVSGTMGSKDTATKGVALFGGDVVISGTLHGGSPLKIGSDIQVVGDDTTLFFSGSLVQAKGNIVTGSHNIVFGRNNVAVNDYVSLFGDGNFAADIFSVLISVDTGLNELTVADGSVFQIGDEVVYVYEIVDDATKIHRTTITGISSNVLTVGSTVALDTTNGTMWVGLLQTLGYSAGTESILFCLSRKVQTSTFSRAEGIYSIAIGSGSYAHGYKNAATGSYSYAEGYQSVATGYASHAEGANFARASGDISHAEGDGTVASGYGSHSEGVGTTASGDYSHAEGNSGIASGESSHAEGQTTVASGQRSHAEGWFAEATGTASHAEGNNTIAEGDYSHAEGTGTRALGVGSHAGGLGTIASGSSQTAIGQFNLRDNFFSLFVVGNGTGDDNTDRSDVFRVNSNNVEVTGSISATLGLSGSLTQLVDGTSYLIAGSNITITSASNGAVTISAAGGGGWPGTTPGITDANDLYVYKCDETTGTTLANTGTGLNGSLTIAGNVYLNSRWIAKSQGSVRFLADNVTDGAESAATAVFSGGSGTIEAYVATRENDRLGVVAAILQGNNCLLISQYYPGGGFASFWNAGVIIGGVVKDTSFATTPKVDMNEPTHVAVTYDGTTGQMLLYVNGIQTAVNNTGLGALPTLDTVSIGNINMPGYIGNVSFRGDITQVRFSNVVRSASYILERAQNCFGL